MRFLFGMDCACDEIVCSFVSSWFSWLLSALRVSVTTTDDMLPEPVDDMVPMPVDEVF